MRTAAQDPFWLSRPQTPIPGAAIPRPPGSTLKTRNRHMKILKRSLLLPALLGAVASVHAATCSVPSAGYPTIQSAVDDATCSTINVAPGVYPENISIPRAVTLNGAQAGQPVAGRTSGGATESIVTGANPAGP